jgi:hypothetical protein
MIKQSYAVAIMLSRDVHSSSLALAYAPDLFNLPVIGVFIVDA